MTRNLIKHKSAISMVVAAIVIVIVVVAAAVGGYYLTQSPAASPSPSTSPTGTATPAATSTPAATGTPAATSTPAPSTEAIANFKAGAYAIYNATTIENGVATSSTYNITIGEETYDSTPCWVLITTAGNESDYVVISERISKANTSEILGNVTMKMYVASELFYEDQFDPATSSSSGAGSEEINPETYTGYATVTVPAGTFENCPTAAVTTTTATSETQVTQVWLSSDVAGFGIVKAEGKINGVLSTTMELIAYGGVS